MSCEATTEKSVTAISTNLLSCEALADDLCVLVNVQVLSCACVAVSDPALLH